MHLHEILEGNAFIKAAGCEKVFTEQVSAVASERQQLDAALDYLRSGDVLVVTKLDRLARSVCSRLAPAWDWTLPEPGFPFVLYPRAWKVRSSICSLPTSALRTKLRVGRAGGCMDAQDGSA